ncbi:MAG: Ppx/GppA family phosphatase, partial [Geminicoccaceae bacterium]|nr:Ppx/GppA family phosphatase [Geminicoccaceae bacterium]
MGLRHKGEPRYAALDLGTNNCRLLVAEPRTRGFVVVDSFSRITRLGEGLAANDRLSEAAMSRTLAALKVCRRIMLRNDVIMARCVATEACRRAANGADFIERVRRVTGIVLEVLGPDEEARLALLGCLPLIDAEADTLLMVDIGGGSTEVMWLDRTAPIEDGRAGRSLSLPIGVVTLAESFAAEADTPSGYAGMVDRVRTRLARSCSESGAPPALNGERTQMLGTSGTVTTLAAVHLDLPRYDRAQVDGVHMPFAAVRHVARRLRALPLADRAAHPCIGTGRADLVVAGCAILDAI